MEKGMLEILIKKYWRDLVTDYRKGFESSVWENETHSEVEMEEDRRCVWYGEFIVKAEVQVADRHQNPRTEFRSEILDLKTDMLWLDSLWKGQETEGEQVVKEGDLKVAEFEGGKERERKSQGVATQEMGNF